MAYGVGGDRDVETGRGGLKWTDGEAGRGCWTMGFEMDGRGGWFETKRKDQTERLHGEGGLKRNEKVKRKDCTGLRPFPFFPVCYPSVSMC